MMSTSSYYELRDNLEPDTQLALSKTNNALCSEQRRHPRILQLAGYSRLNTEDAPKPRKKR
jgi:hypothetical protein